MKHLLSVEDLDRADIERFMERADGFAEVGRRDIKKVPTLRGRTIVNLFYESSTRTQSSFELAAKRLSADTISIKAAGSAVESYVAAVFGTVSYCRCKAAASSVP